MWLNITKNNLKAYMNNEGRKRFSLSLSVLTYNTAEP